MIFEGEERVASGLPWPEEGFWIVARESTLFQRVSLRDIPKASRPKFLEQKIRRLSPFDDTGRFVVEEGDDAMIWLWDESLRSQAVRDMGRRFADFQSYFAELTPVPETVLLPGQKEGSRVTPTINGEEHQEWNDFILTSSVWREAVNDSISETLSPWPSLETSGEIFSEALWWRLGVLALFLVVVLQLGAMSGLSGQRWALEDRNQGAREEAAGLLALRSQVQRIRSDNEQLMEWLHQPSQMRVLVDFDELLQETAEINRWEYKKGELSATITDKKLNNRRFIESLSKGDHFNNVRVDPGARLGNVVISIEVSP